MIPMDVCGVEVKPGQNGKKRVPETVLKKSASNGKAKIETLFGQNAGVEVKLGQAEDVKERVENVNNQAADTTAEDDKKVSKNLDGYSTDPDDYSTDDEYSGSVDLTGEDDSSNEEDSSDVENKNSTKPENVKKRVETVNDQVADSVDDIKYLVKAPAEDDEKVTDNLDGCSTDPHNYSTDDEYSGSVDLTGDDDSSNEEDSCDEEVKNTTKPEDGKERVSETVLKKPASNKKANIETLSGQNAGVEVKLGQAEDVKERVENVNNQAADTTAEDDKKVSKNLDGYSTDPDDYSTDDEYSGSVDLTGEDDSSNEEDSSDVENKNSTKPENVKKRVETVNDQVADSVDDIKYLVKAPAEDDEKVTDNLDGCSTDPHNYSTDDEYSGSVDLTGDDGSSNEEDSSDEEVKNTTKPEDGKKRVSETVLKKPASNKKPKIETLSGQNAGVEVKLGQAEDVKERVENVNYQAANTTAADSKVGDNLDGYSADPDNYSVDYLYSGSVDLAGEEDSSDEENRNITRQIVGAETVLKSASNKATTPKLLSPPNLLVARKAAFRSTFGSYSP